MSRFLRRIVSCVVFNNNLHVSQTVLCFWDERVGVLQHHLDEWLVPTLCQGSSRTQIDTNVRNASRTPNTKGKTGRERHPQRTEIKYLILAVLCRFTKPGRQSRKWSCYEAATHEYKLTRQLVSNADFWLNRTRELAFRTRGDCIWQGFKKQEASFYIGIQERKRIRQWKRERGRARR